MNQITRKLQGTLVERADAVFDFAAMMRGAVAADPTRHAGLVPASTVAQESPLEDQARPWTPEQVRGDDERFKPVTARSSDKAPVDRPLLAANGLLVPGAPIGALAEEFRLIKRHLMATMRAIADADEAKARTILICSARPNDGKTYCALNLAISLAAERELEVLLVDADFAKPDVVARLGLREGPGLLDALADASVDPEAHVIATDIPHLSVLPAGTRSIDDTELLASRRTGAVIAALRAADPNRLILFDSPPALAASPASVLANHVGQVMLVVRADRTSESDVREAVTMLDACPHIQLVLNATSFANGRERFGSYYGREAAA